MLLGLNIIGIEAGPELSGMFSSAAWLLGTMRLEAGLGAGGSNGVIGGAPFGIMGAATGFVIPDWPRTLT